MNDENGGSVSWFGENSSGMTWFGNTSPEMAVASVLSGTPVRIVPPVAARPRRRSASTGDFLSVRAAAREFGIGERTLRHAIRAGDLKAYRPGARTQRVERAAVAEWLRQHAVRPRRGARR